MTDIPSHAQVVVIGGGVIGASVAYHLTKLGYCDVVVLERNAIGSGTTWHSAAGLSMTTEDPAFLRNFLYSRSEIQVVERESGLSVGRKVVGRMVFSHRSASFERLRRVEALGRSAGFPLHILTPAETLDLLPILAPKELLGSLWNPDAYRVDPTGLTEALLRIARRRGARVFENAAVTAIESGDQVRSVTTSKGSIRCEIVINCAGVWARQIAAMVGLPLPIVALEHFFVLTKPIAGLPSETPSFRSGDDLFYGREEVGGLLLGVFDENARLINLPDLPADFSFGLLPENWDQLAPYIDKIVERLPVFGQAEIKTFINGPEAFTFDHRYILGESSRTRGFYTLAGMNSGGIGACMGAGRQLAELIITGAPTEDLTPVDICRFQSFEGSDRWLRLVGPDLTSGTYLSRSHSRPGTRNIRRSPVHSLLQAWQANFQPVCGWEVAESFGDSTTDRVHDEVALLESDAGLVDESHFGKIRVSGKSAAGPLQTLVNDVLPGDGRSAARLPMRNARGGVESVPIVVRVAKDEWLLLVEPAETPRLRRFLHAAAPECRVTDETSGWAFFLLAGPRAKHIITELRPTDTGEADWVHIGVTPALACHLETDIAIICPTEYGATLYEFILVHGKRTAPALGPVGSAAVERRRIIVGQPRWNRDLNAFLPDVRCEGLAGPETGTMVLALRPVEGAPAEAYVHAPVWSNRGCVGYITSAATTSDGEVATIARIHGPLEGELWLDTGSGKTKLKRTR